MKIWKRYYYKVVYENVCGEMRSLTISYPHRVIYEIGKVAKPQPGCGPLCVFKNKKDAIYAAYYSESYVILKVKIRKSKFDKAWVPDKRFSSGKYATRALPEGTVLADEVFPIKVVNRPWK